MPTCAYYTRWARAVPGPPRQTVATKPMQKLEHVDGQKSAPGQSVTENGAFWDKSSVSNGTWLEYEIQSKHSG